MNTVDKAISNLEIMRDEFLKISYKKEHYNSSWGQMLEIMSWDLHKKAQELKEQKYLCPFSEEKLYEQF